MEGFIYNNMFDTKGIEYLIIILFLLMIIPFWIIINRQVNIKGRIRSTLGVLTEATLKVPMGLFFSKNHTWTHLEKSGMAMVGIDDFLMHITGEVMFSSLKPAGSYIRKGELLATIEHEGKKLHIYSPLSGMILNTNELLIKNPEIVNEDPYERGWIYKINPSMWLAETNTYYLAGEALAWSKIELQRFRDFLSGSAHKYSHETSMMMLQDGGELIDRPLAELPDKIWQDFQKSFLNS